MSSIQYPYMESSGIFGTILSLASQMLPFDDDSQVVCDVTTFCTYALSMHTYTIA